jgi:hypothetical protein
MNNCKISALKLSFFGMFLTTYTLVGEVLAYIPIAILLLVKFFQAMEKQVTRSKASGILHSINVFLLVALLERVMTVYNMTILSYYTSFYLIYSASYLVIRLDYILSDKVNDESIVLIITSCIYLLFLCFNPEVATSLSLNIWLLIAVSLYFTFTNQLLRKVSLTSSQILITEQSQWLLLIYSLFRLVSNIFEVKFQLSLIFYTGALVLFLVIAYSVMKQNKQLKTSLKIANVSACILIATLGIEYSYYAVH